MITKDASSIEVLRDNAKTIGGVLGAEDSFLENHKEDHEAFFVDRSILNVQNITFAQIEKTAVGKTYKSQIRKLENKIKELE